jgi:hypothetical protein
MIDVTSLKAETFRKVILAQIAAEGFQKKSLARKCKVSRPQFSLMLHGDKPMPSEVRERLITELNLQPIVERLGL